MKLVSSGSKRGKQNSKQGKRVIVDKDRASASGVRKVIITLLVVVLVGAAAVGGYYLWESGFFSQEDLGYLVEETPPYPTPEPYEEEPYEEEPAHRELVVETVNIVIPMGTEVFPFYFIDEVLSGHFIVTTEFVEPPDVMLPGEQVVELELTDLDGYSTIVYANLIVLPNEVPPEIFGTESSIEVMVGSSVMYRAGVSAYDAFGREIEFFVESDEVDIHTRGVYTVIYWAEDCCGNRIEVERTVYVVEVDIDWVYEQVDEILAEIITEGMTQEQMARAINDWIGTSLTWSWGRDGAVSVMEGAFNAISRRSGNCFIFYALGEVMLTRVGIPNMRIDRIPGTRTAHTWSIINPDGLGWHHFDAMHTGVSRQYAPSQKHMFTDSVAARLTRAHLHHNNIEDYYTYDPLLYPEIVG